MLSIVFDQNLVRGFRNERSVGFRRQLQAHPIDVVLKSGPGQARSSMKDWCQAEVVVVEAAMFVFGYGNMQGGCCTSSPSGSVLRVPGLLFLYCISFGKIFIEA